MTIKFSGLNYPNGYSYAVNDAGTVLVLSNPNYSETPICRGYGIENIAKAMWQFNDASKIISSDV